MMMGQSVSKLTKIRVFVFELLAETNGCSVHGLLDIKFFWNEPMVSDVMVIEGYPFGFNWRGRCKDRFFFIFFYLVVGDLTPIRSLLQVP
jgi:hypothetical protein